MCGNLYVIVKENVKVVLRQGAWAAVLFLFVVPHLYGIANLNGEKAADCLGRLVAFVGIPLFVPLSKPEQVSGLRDVILVKEFPYRISIFLRVVFAALLSAVFICIFEQYMRYRDCDFPTVIYSTDSRGQYAGWRSGTFRQRAFSGNAGGDSDVCRFCVFVL